MNKILLILLFAVTNIFAQQDNEIVEYANKSTLEILKLESEALSKISFYNIKGLTDNKKATLTQLNRNIKNNIDQIISKAVLGQDASLELEKYNKESNKNAIEYLFNYKANLDLINSVINGEGGGNSVAGSTNNKDKNYNEMENKRINIGLNPLEYKYKSSGKIYKKLSEDIRKALIDCLNNAEPEKWNQFLFIITLGNSEILRQYIDTRALNITKISEAVVSQIRGTGNMLSQTGILEDFYLMISGDEPTDDLIKGEMPIVKLTREATRYLADTYLFGLETIRHNQLLYVPDLSIPLNDAYREQAVSKTEPSVSAKQPVSLEQKELPVSKPDNTYTQPYKVTESDKQSVEEFKFEEKYKATDIAAELSNLKNINNANYFNPYMKLLEKTETIIGDFAPLLENRTNISVASAFSTAQDAKVFALGCNVVLAALSFIPSGGASAPVLFTVGRTAFTTQKLISASATFTMVGILFANDGKVISKEIDEGIPAGEILQRHFGSFLLYAWMTVTKIPLISNALNKAPLIRFGVSSYFMYDLSSSLVEINEQRIQINEDLETGKITEAEARLKKLDLSIFAVTTATFLAHTARAYPHEADAVIKKYQIDVAAKKHINIAKVTDPLQSLVVVKTVDGKSIIIGEKINIVLQEYNKQIPLNNLKLENTKTGQNNNSATVSSTKENTIIIDKTIDQTGFNRDATNSKDSYNKTAAVNRFKNKLKTNLKNQNINEADINRLMRKLDDAHFTPNKSSGDVSFAKKTKLVEAKQELESFLIKHGVEKSQAKRLSKEIILDLANNNVLNSDINSRYETEIQTLEELATFDPKVKSLSNEINLLKPKNISTLTEKNLLDTLEKFEGAGAGLNKENTIQTWKIKKSGISIEAETLLNFEFKEKIGKKSFDDILQEIEFIDKQIITVSADKNLISTYYQYRYKKYGKVDINNQETVAAVKDDYSKNIDVLKKVNKNIGALEGSYDPREHSKSITQLTNTTEINKMLTEIYTNSNTVLASKINLSNRELNTGEKNQLSRIKEILLKNYQKKMLTINPLTQKNYIDEISIIEIRFDKKIETEAGHNSYKKFEKAANYFVTSEANSSGNKYIDPSSEDSRVEAIQRQLDIKKEGFFELKINEEKARLFGKVYKFGEDRYGIIYEIYNPDGLH